MNTSLNTLAVAFALALSATTPLAHAQTETKVDEARPAQKVYHAGGPRHDVMAHEASVRAKQSGARMTEPTVHPGGRHNEDNHKAAIRAESKEAESAKAPEAK